jgi:hypothetical protein
VVTARQAPKPFASAVRAYEEGRWVREAALAYAAKHRARQTKQAA